MLVKFNFSQNSRTRTTPIAGHLTVVSACSGGHLTNCFFKSQIPRGLPGGGGPIAVGFDSYITFLTMFIHMVYPKSLSPNRPVNFTTLNHHCYHSNSSDVIFMADFRVLLVI